MYGRRRIQEPGERGAFLEIPSYVRYVCAGLVVLLACVCLWAQVHGIAITVDGQPLEVAANASLDEVYLESGAQVAPGNYLYVTGEVAKQGAGWPFDVTVNGAKIPNEDISKTFLAPDDSVVFSDGSNRYEPYDVQESWSVQPKLQMDGDVGSVEYVSQWGYAGEAGRCLGRESHQMGEIVLKPVQNMVVAKRNINPQTAQNKVAITFDDGPSEYSAQYVDILNQYNAHGTFFEIGRNISEHADIPAWLQQQGEGVGTHTMSHGLSTHLAAEDLRADLQAGIQALADAGVHTAMLRPPYGDFSPQCWLASGGLISSAITWTQDSRDWKQPGVDAIVSHALSSIHAGSIILMHAGGGDRSQDLQALPRILQALSERGYQVVSVAELLATDPAIPQAVSAGTATMPSDATWPMELAQ